MFEFLSTSFWRELEQKKHSIRDMLWKVEAIFEKPVQTVMGMIREQLTRSEKVAFHEKYHVLMTHSENHKFRPVINREYRLQPER